MSNITISPVGVNKLAANLHTHKATGPDDISARLLKVLADELAPVFTILFQVSIMIKAASLKIGRRLM